MDDLPIPEDQLPEPVRRMIEMARASGGQVRMLPIGKLGEGGPRVLELAGLGRDPDAPQCDCHWCTLDRKLQAVNATTKLDVDQKYEAAIELFSESARESLAQGDEASAFSKRIQAAAYGANRANRRWMLRAIEARIDEMVQEMAKHMGLKAPEDTEAALGAIRDKATEMAGSEDHDAMVASTARTLLVSDMVKLRNTMREVAPTFQVNTETDPKALAAEV